MAETEVRQLKLSLDKALDGGRESGEVLDILEAISKIQVSIDILRSTLVGKSVANAQKKFGTDTCGQLAGKLVQQWKAVASAAKKKDGPSTASTEETKAAPPQVKSASIEAKISAQANSGKILESIKAEGKKAVPAPNPNPLDIAKAMEDEQYSSLSQIRKKIVSTFAERLNANTPNSSVAVMLGYKIEDSINSMHSAEFDKAQYTSKARSLLFNVKQNEQLRIDITEGNLPAEGLVHLTQAQLATSEQRAAQDKISEAAMMERRSDYFKINRDKIAEANGIDPNTGGEFTCRKCKSTKTTHYQMQTRSADEPMTVFISCLKCGNRWRE
jgi:transcription elongation factor S-II